MCSHWLVVLKAIVTKIWRQPVGIKFTQSLNVVITIAGMETIVAPNMNIVRKGVIIGSTTNLDSGSGKNLVKRNLNRCLGLLIANNRIVETHRWCLLIQ